ncbi:MAG: ABC transporter permease, partial [Acidobacteriota bacterium]
MMWRWIEAFLRRCLPAERIEDAVGDLMELHPERRERFGAWAPLVTAVDALSFGTTMLFARVRDLLREGFDAVLSATFEVRLAWRLVRKRPLLNAVALLTLAAGLGLMSVGLSYASGLLFSELPYADGERYVRIEVTDPATGRRIRSLDPGWLDRLRTDVPAFTFFGGKDHEQLNIFHANGDVDTVTGVVMSGGAFDVLPATPRLGRTLTAADSAPGARPVVVLRESLWRTRFGASDAVLGQSIDVGGERRQVVGVLPDTFLFPNRPLLWVPLEERHWGGSADGSSPGIELFAVLHSEADRRLAKDQVEAAGSPLPPSADAADAAPRLRVVGYTEPSRPGEVWAGTGGLIAALLLILTVIAAQVGHLFAARNAGRAKELSMRLALGARRSQVVAQLWWEVAVIVALAAGLAAWGSHGVLRWLQAQLDEAPFWLRLEPGLPAFAALTAIALFTTWAAGLAPALRVTRRTTLAGVAGGRGAVGPSGDAGRTGSAMAIFEMAMAVALFT